jgi:hypothetical protein
MPENMNNKTIESVLQMLGERIEAPAKLFLIGGSALALLGNPRLTIDIDFIGDDISPSKVYKALMQIASELKVYVEPVALDKFIPVPEGSSQRNIRIGSFGNLEVYVADSYSITLSKIERGFDTDIDDIPFLLKHGYVEFEKLEQETEAALIRAREFDIDRDEMLAHLAIVRERSEL